MKKYIVSTLAVMALATASYGQGYVYLNNLANTGVQGGNGGTLSNPTYSANVTSNGLFFTTDATQDQGTVGAGQFLMGEDFSYILEGSTTGTAGSFSVIASATTTGEISGDNPAYGQLQGPGASEAVGSGAVNPVYLEIYAWEDGGAGDAVTYSTYAAAVTGGDYTAFGEWANPAGASATSPTTPSMVSMPDIEFSNVVVPEPATLAFAGLGGLSVLLFRRRK